MAAVVVAVAAPALADPRDELVFEESVRPIFAKHCFACHGQKQRAELDLRTPASILRGSESGEILSKTQKESLLYEVIVEQRMPPVMVC